MRELVAAPDWCQHLAMLRGDVCLACMVLGACGTGELAQVDIAPPPDWSTSFDSSWDDRVVIAADLHHGLAVAGTFGDSVDIGSVTLRSAGREDVLIARYAPDGELAWGRAFGGSGTDEATAVGIAPTGDVYAAGRFEGSIDFGGGVLEDAGSVDLSGNPVSGHDGPDLFMAAFDVNGEHLWSLRFGAICTYDPDYGTCSNWHEQLGGIAVRPGGGVCLTASAEGMLDLGDLDDRPLEPWNAGFVACLGPDGQVDWLVSLETDSRPMSIATDAAGIVYVLSSVGSRNLSLDVIGVTGTPLRHQSFRRGRLVFGANLAARPDGGLLMTGTFHGRLDLNEAVLEAPGPELPPEQGISTDRELFIAAFNPEGGLTWARDFGAPTESHEGGTSVVPFGDGLVVGGYYEDPVDLGGGPLPDAADRTSNALLARFDASGEHLWSDAYGSDGFDTITSLSALQTGQLCFAAGFEATMILPIGDRDGAQPHGATFGCLRPWRY